MREDWVEASIGDVCEIQNGFAFKSKNYTNAGSRIMRIANVQKGRIIDKDPKFYPEQLAKGFMDFSIEAGDILISLTGDVGRAGVMPMTLLPALLNQRVGRFHAFKSNLVTNEYLFRFLDSREFEKKVILSAKGVAQLNTSTKKIKEISLPLPPLPEQRAIVGKLEALFSELDSGIAELQRAQAKLKVYRQAVLKKAFEGELTKEWRAQQKDLPTAEELLAQIKEERSRHYEQQLSEWTAVVKDWEKKGEVGKKPGKPSIYPSFSLSGEAAAEGPRHWGRTALGNLTSRIVDGTHHTPKYKPSGIQFISAKDIRSGRIDFSNTKYISKEEHEQLIKRCYPRRDDLLLTKSGTIGRVALVKTDEQFSLFESVALIPNLGVMSPEYMVYCVYFVTKSGFGKANQKGVAVRHLHLEDIRQMPIPIPSLQEQHQIVEAIESRLSVCDKLEETIATNLQKAEALRQSILKKAFEGRLLSTAELAACKKEKDWCPAGELLGKNK